MKRTLINLINLYQKMPLSTHSYCRYTPTCSEYAKEAIREYGSLKGCVMAIKRILRCNPFGGYGYDPVVKKELNMKKIAKYILLVVSIFTLTLFTSGCDNDEMDGINIAVTNYANEYIVDRLYSKHSKITSIYPDGVDTATYKLSKKQKQEFSKYEIFVYNGLIESERSLATDLLDINPSLKIIDTAYVLETDYSPEELWLNPSSLLMMSQNVKNGLLEYIDSTYLQKEIQESYKELKIDLSTLDVEYRDAIKDTNNKNIVVDDSALKYLEKFGLNVYCIDNSATDKILADVEELINNKNVSYIITFKNNELSNNSKEILDNHSDIKVLELHILDVLTDEERDEKKDYLTIMEDNLNLLNQEL